MSIKNKDFERLMKISRKNKINRIKDSIANYLPVAIIFAFLFGLLVLAFAAFGKEVDECSQKGGIMVRGFDNIPRCVKELD